MHSEERRLPATATEAELLAVVAALHGVAAERAVPPARIALAWLLGRPGVRAPILGVTKPRHIEDAVAALDIVLNPDEVARLEAPYVPQSPYGQS